MPLTAEELRAMRLADEEIERNFQLTADDIARARETDRVALFERKDAAAQRAVAQQKVYRATNREKVAARKKAYYEAHREEEAARRKAYRERRKAREELKNGTVDRQRLGAYRVPPGRF